MAIVYSTVLHERLPCTPTALMLEPHGTSKRVMGGIDGITIDGNALIQDFVRKSRRGRSKTDFLLVETNSPQYGGKKW